MGLPHLLMGLPQLPLQLPRPRLLRTQAALHHALDLLQPTLVALPLQPLRLHLAPLLVGGEMGALQSLFQIGGTVLKRSGVQGMVLRDRAWY